MRDFTFHSPTEVIFGRDAEFKTAEAAVRYGANRVLLVYGKGSVVRSGLLDRICGTFKEAGLAYGLFGGVEPNPRLGHTRKGVRAAIDMKADMIIGVGGGSAIDAAKAIAHGAANPDIDIWQVWLRKQTITRSQPVGAVLTIPAAGSEMSDSAVLTNEETQEKRGLSTQLNRPAFAIMNPALAATLPAFQVACGVTDIYMHTLERYFSPVTGNDFTDELAEALMRVVIRNGRVVVKNPADYDAMSEIMWCSSISHNGLTGLGGEKDFSAHQLGQAIGGIYDKAHGATLSAVWGSWARYVLGTNPSRFEKYAKNVWGAETAEAGIEKTVAFFSEIGMPVCLSELGIGVLSDAELEALAYKCTYGKIRKIGSFRVLDYDDVLRIFRAANQ
jgi:alcohol dehydrogenase YqhD (iron-dependent ADH family)